MPYVQMHAGYESDLERDASYDLAAKRQAMAQALLDLSESTTAAGVGNDANAKEQFLQDHAWMDEYRRDVVSRCEPSPACLAEYLHHIAHLCAGKWIVRCRWPPIECDRGHG
jgi:hypothetical protein